MGGQLQAQADGFVPADIIVSLRPQHRQAYQVDRGAT